ncbi:hypothetical protein GCM10011584_21690 [Nocardioides phosphati]|uniref:HTH hxlR-type domain-containing protein n=2 Tax=Nocardioides phosphati TaxID=1867775 RepID=A0ABQ2NBD9_9ACTN|nr:hypothetical protein GCM10011584_21690 [Nocardioides phosphati]
MAAFDLLGRRWVLQIVGELGAADLGFNELQRRIGRISSSVLATRLRELSELSLVEVGDDGTYLLTELGRSLLLSLHGLFEWSDHWAASRGQVVNEPLDPALVNRLQPEA